MSVIHLCNNGGSPLSKKEEKYGFCTWILYLRYFYLVYDAWKQSFLTFSGRSLYFSPQQLSAVI